MYKVFASSFATRSQGINVVVENAVQKCQDLDTDGRWLILNRGSNKVSTPETILISANTALLRRLEFCH